MKLTTRLVSLTGGVLGVALLGALSLLSRLPPAEELGAARTLLLAGAGLALLCVYWTARGWVREIEGLEDHALEVSAGGASREPRESGSEELTALIAALRRMRTALEAARDRAEAGRKLWSEVFAQLPDGVVMVDRHWSVVDANPSFCAMLRQPQPRGMDLVELFRERSLFLPFEQAIRTCGPAEARVTRPDGSVWEVVVRPLAAGQEGVALGVLRDISAAERHESMRRRFVADVSHELRSPLTSIAAASETLEGMGEEGSEGARLLEIIRRQAGRMQDLVADLTDLSQIESGAVGLHLERVDLPRLCEELCTEYREGAAHRGGVRLELVAPGPLTVFADRRRLGQILRNLLDNAVKFSPAGSRVTVSAVRELGEVVVSVADQGPGIPAMEQENIFQRFYQVDRSRDRGRPGTGLGLAIVKHLAALHGAQVELESRTGEGSTFRVRFPARDGEEAQA